MHRVRFLCPIAISALVACQPSVSSTGVEAVTGGPTCSACRLERTLLARITDAALPAMGTFTQVHVNSDSTFLVLAGGGPIPDGVYLADRNGSIYRRLGREGEGPGEYRFPQFSMESPTSYAIVDVRLQRLTKISKKDLSVESTQHIPVRVSGIPPILFPDGTWVLPTPGGPGNVLSAGLMNVISPSGELIRTFPVGIDSTATESDHIGFLSVAEGTEFWISFTRSGRIERWDISGRLVRAVERKGDWFRPRTPDSEDGELFTRIKGVVEDEHGRLWVHFESNRVDVYERSAVNPDGSPTTITIQGSSRDPKDRETRIEVIDLQTLTVLTSLTIPEWSAWTTPGSFHLTVNRTPETVIPLVEVWAFDLVGEQ
jgi:hypothetical protein